MKILKITNKKTGQVQQSDFKTIEECEAHFEKHKAKGHWGKEEYSITHPSYTVNHPEIVEVVGVSAQAEVLATYDANGIELTPYIFAVAEVIAVAPVAAWDEVFPEVIEVVPAEYTKEILDVAQKIQSISPRQIRLALLSIGKTEEMIDAAINTLPSPDKEGAMIAWKHSTYFERSAPFVDAIGLIAGLDSAGLDSLWQAGLLL